ncbi:multidrug resistance-associated protein 1-like isoform X2 [Watersipora subatra]|uniref:multidrug resistance-associated protein 1-like isoform X2 n=1 Tax=Watersipora subatra TaxID=2589382 RepID=UPI00355BEEAB
MLEFCEGDFLDSGLSINRDYPDTTPCFRQVICYILPSVLFMIVSTCRLYHLYYSKKKGCSNHWLASAQTIICICLMAPALADLSFEIHIMLLGDKSYGVIYLAVICRVLALGLAVVVIQLEKKKAARYFGGLFGFWLLLGLTGIFILYSEIRQALTKGMVERQFQLATFIIHYILVGTQLALAFVPNPYIAVKENSSPELRACFASRLTFWWFNDLIMKGYRRPLKDSDLHDLNDVDKASNWVPRFERAWQLETFRLRRPSLQQESKNVKPKAAEVLAQELDDFKASEKMLPEAGDSSATGAEKTESGHQLAEGKRPSLVKCLAKVFLPSVFICALLKLCHDILLFVQPLLLKSVIQFVSDSDEADWKGYMYGIVMFAASIAQSFFLHHYFYRATLIGMRLRSTVCASVYNKALKLSNSSREKSTVGEIVNLMSVDAQRFMNIMTYLNTTWSAPLQIIVSLGLLLDTLGPSVLAGFAVMILVLPLNIFLGNQIKKFQVGQMKEKDKRVKLMSELLNGIKVLKLYAWEESFCNIIRGIRNKELNLLKKASYINAFSNFVWQCTPFFVTLISFAVYVISDEKNVLDAEKAFVSLSLFNIMRFPMGMIPNIVTSLIQASVSVNRIANFLHSEELHAGQINRDSNQADAINMKNCSFAWDKDGETITLHDISTSVKHKELVAVVGVVGTGKSSLISGLLGDMYKLKGCVSVDGMVAYVAQEAWIQNAALRDNILFGSEYDQGWYDQVVEACALLPDLAVLPHGDLTEIGEKGINLSGGQKQRVSLARAVYSRADIYLLDDPLSAVDAHVGKHIFDKVIGHTGLLRGRTRLLVTHGINFLPQVDNIFVIKDGRLSEWGSFKQLLERNEAFADFLRTHFRAEKENLTEDDNLELLQQMEEAIEGEDLEALVRERVGSHGDRSLTHEPVDGDKLSLDQIHAAISKQSLGQDVSGQSEKNDTGSAERSEEKEDEAKKLIQTETSKEGLVKMAVFKSYLASMGWLPAALLLFFFVVDQGCAMGGNIWLSKWSDDEESFNDTSARNMYLGVYASFGISQGLFALAATFSLAIGSWKASRTLHNDLLSNVVRCSMLFFDTTPTGRILNRFSKDTDVIDATLPINSRSFIWHLLTVIGTLIIIAISTFWFLLIVIPLAVMYILIQRFYVATSRQLKRIESVNLSPIYSHFEESIQGAATIRAYKKQGSFMSESLCRVDKHQQAYYPIIISNRWLAVRLEFIGSCIVLSAVMLAVISRNMSVKTLTAGIAGLSISYSTSVTNTLNCLVRMTSDLENNIVAVERVNEYSRLDTEADWKVACNRPLPGWPSIGSIVFDGYSVRYREGLDLVLKNISCTIAGGEKIGICGRTGAGKSSLTLALFRILEGAEGAIYIDDVRIGAIGLHDLRNVLTIIPQDPVVFSV